MLIYLLLLVFQFLQTDAFYPVDPDETLTFAELIASRGYFLQEYNVRTKDGYIIKVHRPVPLNYDPRTYNRFRKPVIAFHGLLNDASYWYWNSPYMTNNESYCGENFGFCMLRSGRYDLWVPNARGNGYSMGHVKYSSKQSKFWEFSWDDIANYDLPAVIDFVVRRTRRRRIGYVGFSQGGGTIMAALSLHPRLTRIIHPVVLWAPAILVGRASSILGVPMRRLHGFLSIPTMFPIGNPAINPILQWQICRPLLGQALCNFVSEQFFGSTNMNFTRIPTYTHFAPSSCSNWQVQHFGQNGESRRFARYTFPSVERNLARYGQTIAPEYPLHRIPPGFKILMIHGPSDTIIEPKDILEVEAIFRRLRFNIIRHQVRNPSWSHIDFVIGMEYNIETADGYILKLHRPVPFDYDPIEYNLFRKPLIAFHGLINDATYWFWNSPFLTNNESYCGENFGFCLLRSGRYDLWVPNARGNGYSMDHVKYSTQDTRFWEFSWDDIANYDVTAVIDFVKKQTKSKKIAYVGFSQGGAIIMAAMSLHPHLAKIIHPIVLWAPAIMVGRASSLIGIPMRRLHPLLSLPGKFITGNVLVRPFLQWQLCRPLPGQIFCNSLADQIFGASNINITRIPTYTHFAPSPVSNWQIQQFGQNGASRRFARYTFPTVEKNLARYGQPTGPDYPLHQIPSEIKILLIHGRSDTIVEPMDILELETIFRHHRFDVTRHLVQNPTWSHGDFVVGIGAGRLLNDPTLKYLDLYR
ncbi:hypothetical protein RDWZM_001728 [Blomia tropicalis]|uniref:Uncharacterized protein n=1 Tax=Blomia tropicalis TaxID=40697 RepID=A0A9Q0MDL3_BLOTA|nr:hypothetical protein RDWZM_001728 [Blomia tropicalis]